MENDFRCPSPCTCVYTHIFLTRISNDTRFASWDSDKAAFRECFHISSENGVRCRFWNIGTSSKFKSSLNSWSFRACQHPRRLPLAQAAASGRTKCTFFKVERRTGTSKADFSLGQIWTWTCQWNYCQWHQLTSLSKRIYNAAGMHCGSKSGGPWQVWKSQTLSSTK